MNPAIFSNLPTSEEEEKVLVCDSYKTCERSATGASPQYAMSTTQLQCFSNSVCSIMICVYTLDIFRSDTGAPQSFTFANSNLKALFYSKRSRLPQSLNNYGISPVTPIKLVGYDEYPYAYNDGLADGVDQARQQNKLFISVIDDKFCVYMPPWRAYGESEGNVSTWRFTSTNGIDWVAEGVFLNQVTPSTDPIPLSTSEYTSYYKTVYNLDVNKPVITWSVKKLNGVYFLWMSQNTEYSSGWSSGGEPYSKPYWTACWTSIDGLVFTKMTIPNNVNGIIRGPWNSECIGYAHGHLYFLSEYFVSSSNYKAAYFYYSNDMGQTWSRQLIEFSAQLNSSTTPIAVVAKTFNIFYNGAWTLVNGFLCMASDKAYLYIVQNGTIDISGGVQTFTYNTTNTGTPATFVTNFRDCRILDNLGVITQSGSSMYFISIPNSSEQMNYLPVKYLNYDSIVGVTKNNSYIHFAIYYSRLKTVYIDATQLALSTKQFNNNYASYSGTENSMHNSYNSTLTNTAGYINNSYYNPFNGKYTIIGSTSTPTIRQTTDFETVTIRNMPSNISTTFNNDASFPTLVYVNPLNGYQYALKGSSLYKTTDDWNTTSLVTTVTNTFSSIGTPRCYAFDYDNNAFIGISEQANTKLTLLKDNNTSYVTTSFSTLNNVPLTRIINLGTNIYALSTSSRNTYPNNAGNNEVYKITYNSQSLSYDFTLLYSSPGSSETIINIIPYVNPSNGSKKIILIGNNVSGSGGKGRIVLLNEDGSYISNNINYIKGAAQDAWSLNGESYYATIRAQGAIDYVNNILYYTKYIINLNTNIYSYMNYKVIQNPFADYTQGQVAQYYIQQSDSLVNIVNHPAFAITEYKKVKPVTITGTYVKDSTCAVWEHIGGGTGFTTVYWNNLTVNCDNSGVYQPIVGNIIPDQIFGGYYIITGVVETVSSPYFRIYYSIDRVKTYI